MTAMFTGHTSTGGVLSTGDTRTSSLEVFPTASSTVTVTVVEADTTVPARALWVMATGPVQSETPSTIRRWQGPVRIGMRFGASVSANMRAADTARVAALVAQLARATRHPIRMDNTNPNFIVEVVNEDERQALGPTISAALPGLTGPELAGITSMPRSTYCLVYAQSSGNSSIYTRAFAVIRAEHPDLLRLSCLHEEIAQGLGLANDSPRARPTIFNDDEEFSLLTPQDVLMLRMLYDPSLTPGMTAEQARPVAAALATRFLGGES